jgi:hypothetical protein
MGRSFFDSEVRCQEPFAEHVAGQVAAGVRRMPIRTR